MITWAKDVILADKFNRSLLMIACLAIPMQFIIFKLLYPYAGFIKEDSYYYLQAANLNSNINFYPIGYSKFLRIFREFTTSDTALVCFQYFLIEFGAVWMLFTLIGIFDPGKRARLIMGITVVFNPAFLYVANYISSDALFLGLSLLWFTATLWILYRPGLKVICWEVALLFFVFAVRYNALYYPFVAMFAFILSKHSLSERILGIIVNFFVIAIFMIYTADQFKKLTGIRQFSPFSGWQLANNALGGYRYVESQHLNPASAQFNDLDFLVHRYFDTTESNPPEKYIDNTYYMWGLDAPLQQFMKIRSDSNSSELKRWASIAPLYYKYGRCLIRQYPGTFVRYYILPNLLHYYAPPVEFLGTYNMGMDTVERIAAMWFKYKTTRVKSAFSGFDVPILEYHPALFGIMNGLYLIGLTYAILFGFFQRQRVRRRIMIVTFIMWLANFGFSIIVSPIMLRYQLFPMAVFSFLVIILVDYTLKDPHGSTHPEQAHVHPI